MLAIVLLFTNILTGCGDTPIDDLTPSNGLEKVFDLPSELSEASGIILYDSLIWTFNDSGQDNTLYGLDLKDGSIKKRLHIYAENVDWEDITQDAENIYIGDFGNNLGIRRDLCIYFVGKEEINDEVVQYIEPEKIEFYFEDQYSFIEQPDSSAFDCESLFTVDDSLYVFTKNWREPITGLYRLPKTPGSYAARKKHSFDSDGLITGADFDPDSNELVICGYKQYIPYIIYFKEADRLNLYEVAKSRTNFFDQFGLQVEGVALADHFVYLCAENSARPQALFKYSLE